MAASSSDPAVALGATPRHGGFVEVEAGVRLWVERAGAGPPLVLIPGLGAGTWLWDTFADRLAEHFSLIMPELRGGGRSDKPDRRYTIRQFGADLSTLLDRLGVAECDLLGASLGGYVAQQFAATWPERVRKLVLVATSLGGDEQVGPAGEMLARTIRPHGRTRRDRLEDAYALGFTAEFRAASREVLDRITEWRTAHPQPEWAYYRQLIAGSSFEGAALARGISAPTLICMGREDPLVPPVNAALLQQHIPGSRVVMLDGRHLFFIENSRAFAATVLEFLRPAVPGSGLATPASEVAS
jgi:pimeloyl-ACP methyl ester carboxylesterase